MTELILERNERLRLRADAHHLNPVVLIGEKGMTPAVMKEIARALDDHSLVKVHVAGDDREEREEIYHTVADELGAARIQAIGKMLVFFRPPVEKEQQEKELGLSLLRAKAEPGARGIKKPTEKKKKVALGKPSSAKDAKRKSKARSAAKRKTKKASLA